MFIFYMAALLRLLHTRHCGEHLLTFKIKYWWNLNQTSTEWAPFHETLHPSANTCSSRNMLTCKYKRAHATVFMLLSTEGKFSDSCLCEQPSWVDLLIVMKLVFICVCVNPTLWVHVWILCSYTADWVITWSALGEAFRKQIWPPTTPRISATFSKWTVKCSRHQPVGTSQLPVLFPVFFLSAPSTFELLMLSKIWRCKLCFCSPNRSSAPRRGAASDHTLLM